jgi:hypothetical protein
VRDEDVVAGRAHGAQQTVLGRHPGGESDGAGPALQRRETLSSAVRVGFAVREYS